MEPLHPRVGKQVLVLKGAVVPDSWPKGADSVCVLASRETMEQLWAILNNLHEASKDLDGDKSDISRVIDALK